MESPAANRDVIPDDYLVPLPPAADAALRAVAQRIAQVEQTAAAAFRGLQFNSVALEQLDTTFADRQAIGQQLRRIQGTIDQSAAARRQAVEMLASASEQINAALQESMQSVSELMQAANTIRLEMPPGFRQALDAIKSSMIYDPFTGSGTAALELGAIANLAVASGAASHRMPNTAAIATSAPVEVYLDSQVEPVTIPAPSLDWMQRLYAGDLVPTTADVAGLIAWLIFASVATFQDGFTEDDCRLLLEIIVGAIFSLSGPRDRLKG